ncbi:Diacylglycerol O-acyltransferase 2 [Lobulomyces angularis]|nr:Diacylglycerol O-acyltransferase 2 [Lobulomyces angularis]
MTLKKEQDLVEENGPFLLGLHPHGVLGYSHFALFTSNYSNYSDLFPKIKMHVGTLNVNLIAPFIRETLLTRGFISVNKNSINHTLQDSKSNAVGIVIGGAKESLFAVPGRNTVVLKNRKGFVKLAIQNGASLVPVYSFGENYLYKQVQNQTLKKIQDFLTRYLSFAPVIFYGRWGTLMPFKRNVVTCVGNPIMVKKNENPTDEEIEFYHQEYMKGLTELFNKYKDEYDPDRIEDLVIL